MENKHERSSEGKAALGLLLVTMKLKGVLNDEMINEQEGDALLNKPFSQWPKELQQKLEPYGAGPHLD